MTNEEFIEWLKQEIKSQGFTSERQFARSAGIGVATINMLLNRKKPLRIDVARRIAKALSIPQLDLLQRAGIVEPSVEALVSSDMTIRQIVEVVSGLEPAERQDLLEYALWRLSKQEERGGIVDIE